MLRGVILLTPRGTFSLVLRDSACMLFPGRLGPLPAPIPPAERGDMM